MTRFFLIFKARFTMRYFKCSQRNIILQSINLMMDVPKISNIHKNKYIAVLNFIIC